MPAKRTEPWYCLKCGSTRRNKGGDCAECARVSAAAWYAANRGKAAEHRKKKRAEDPTKDRQRSKAYRKANLETRRAAEAAYAKANKQKRAEANAKWRAANKEKKAAMARAWQERNRLRLKVKNATYYETNKPRMRTQMKAWVKANPEKKQTIENNRRSRELRATGSHTTEQWLSLLASYHGKCIYCGAKATTRDHITPLTKDGTNDIENIVPACKSCNSKKHNTSLLVWMTKKAHLLRKETHGAE